MNPQQLENAFYKEIKNSIVIFADLTIKNIKKTDDSTYEFLNDDEKASYNILSETKFSEQEIMALKKVLMYASAGVVHSLFTSIDGDTSLSSNGKALELIDLKTGEPLTEGSLHENFVCDL